MLITWCSNKQSFVALSINEAEIISANEAIREALYIQHIIEELSSSNAKINLYTDNTGVIKFAKRGVGQRTKHLDLRLKHLYDLYNKKMITIEYVNTSVNVTDIFTKFVNRSTLINLRDKLKLRYRKK